MAEKKITKRDRFNQLRALVADQPELVQFIDRELELLAKKNAPKGDKELTPTQKENEKLKEKIVELLANKPDGMNATEVGKAVDPELSNQRIASLLSKLVSAGALTREEIKGRPIFKKAV